MSRWSRASITLLPVLRHLSPMHPQGILELFTIIHLLNAKHIETKTKCVPELGPGICFRASFNRSNAGSDARGIGLDL